MATYTVSTIHVVNATVVPNMLVIADNPIAKLMYYLNCVNNCTTLQINPRLLDCGNYSVLSDIERRDVVVYAYRYRPAVLRNILFFEVDDQNYLLPDSPNKFLEVTDPVVLQSFNLASTILVVDNVASNIHRVMIHRFAWMIDFFEQPYNQEKWRIGLAPRPARRTNEAPLWCFSGVLCLFLLPPVGVVLLVIACCKAGEEEEQRRQYYYQGA